MENKQFKKGDLYSVKLTEEMAKQLNILNNLGFSSSICKITSFVFETQNYDKLKLLLGNRIIKKSNIEKQKRILEKNGFKSTNPVIINESGEIIDGQHRVVASKELNIPIKITVDTIEKEQSLKTTIELNNSGKAWGLYDYINAYAQNGNVNYKKLLELQENLETNISICITLYRGSKAGSTFIKHIASGNFIFNDGRSYEAKKIKKELELLKSAIDNPKYKKVINTQTFVLAYLKVRKLEGFDFENLKEQFSKMRYIYFDIKEPVKSLIEIYNYKKVINKISINNI